MESRREIMNSKHTVFNAEPFGFSKSAEMEWSKVGNYFEGDLEDENLSNVFRRTTILIVRLRRFIDQKILNYFPQLQFVISATTGTDHLDIDELEKRGITLLTLRGETEFLATIPSTAEHTFALLLSLVRNVPAATNSVLRGEWNRDAFRGLQLAGKTIGIIGLGRTGNMVAGYASAFGMLVRYYDPFKNDSNFQKIDKLEDLLSQSDILTLHVHLNKDTQHLLNADNLVHCKAGIIIVNTSRGKIIDESALVKLLETGQVAKVATDVLYNELNSYKESPLFVASNAGKHVLITPHLGGATWDAMHTCEEFMVRKFNTVSGGVRV